MRVCGVCVCKGAKRTQHARIRQKKVYNIFTSTTICNLLIYYREKEQIHSKKIFVINHIVVEIVLI